jgi:hypothetical protein
MCLENTEGAIKNEQSRETGNIGYSRQRQKKIVGNKLDIYNFIIQRITFNFCFCFPNCSDLSVSDEC